jgi:hypothetical protein
MPARTSGRLGCLRARYDAAEATELTLTHGPPSERRSLNADHMFDCSGGWRPSTRGFSCPGGVACGSPPTCHELSTTVFTQPGEWSASSPAGSPGAVPQGGARSATTVLIPGSGTRVPQGRDRPSWCRTRGSSRWSATRMPGMERGRVHRLREAAIRAAGDAAGPAVPPSRDVGVVAGEAVPAATTPARAYACAL